MILLLNKQVDLLETIYLIIQTSAGTEKRVTFGVE